MFSRFPWHVWVLSLSFLMILVPAPGGAQAVATPDPLWNGAAIGAGVYLSVIALAAGAAGGFEDCDAGCWAVNGALAAGIGTAIGVGIDALVKGRKTIYQSADSKGASHVVRRPFVGVDARGAALSVAW
jgi:hypothetical protein